MPNSTEERSHDPAEGPLPQPKSPQDSQIIPDPQVAPAEPEGGIQPADTQGPGNGQLRQHRRSAVQGTHRVGGGAQQEPGQKAAQKPAPDQPRIHRHSPLRCRGSS